jgi:hypothetical protein
VKKSARNNVQYGELSVLLVILLDLPSQIKIFGEAPPKSKASKKNNILSLKGNRIEIF